MEISRENGNERRKREVNIENLFTVGSIFSWLLRKMPLFEVIRNREEIHLYYPGYSEKKEARKLILTLRPNDQLIVLYEDRHAVYGRSFSQPMRHGSIKPVIDLAAQKRYVFVNRDGNEVHLDVTSSPVSKGDFSRN